jgi:hypothetical protein
MSPVFSRPSDLKQRMLRPWISGLVSQAFARAAQRPTPCAASTPPLPVGVTMHCYGRHLALHIARPLLLSCRPPGLDESLPDSPPPPLPAVRSLNQTINTVGAPFPSPLHAATAPPGAMPTSLAQRSTRVSLGQQRSPVIGSRELPGCTRVWQTSRGPTRSKEWRAEPQRNSPS